MTFKDVLAQVIDWLQQDKRITYRALQRQFDLDDAYLEDLQDAILYTHPQVHNDDRGLVWTGAPAPPKPDAQRGADAEVRFYALLSAVMGLLQRESRVTYRRLRYVFTIDEALLQEIREELTFTQCARDERGTGLVWTGETPPMPSPVAHVSSQPDTTAVTSPAVPTSSPVTETLQPAHGLTMPAEVIATDLPQNDEPATTESPRLAPEAERRQLTVMFCDLADSTKLSQQLDPEDLRDVVRAYQATAAEVMHQYDGHIAQYLGDGLLIYFGWPRAHEDDVHRAMYAGLEIVEAITTTLNPRLEAEKGVQLTVRLGVHTGPVVVGEIGGDGRHENLATGETVNIAARLEGLAAPNTMVISSVTARLVRNMFALESLGLYELKGMAEPMEVFRVIGHLETNEEATAAVGAPFLVGREEEIGLLLRHWKQSKEGLGQVVLISGAPGIGKSSLIEALRAQVRDEGMPRIAFRCSPYHTNSVLYPVITHVERLLDLQREDTAETKLSKLEQGLQSYNLPLEEVVPLFAALLSIPLDARYPAPPLTPQRQKQQTLDALVAWMLEEAERQPVLGVWEDLHWADPSTLELLGLVLEQTPMVPILSVLTFRPEFSPPWLMRSHMTPITLNRLERRHVEALMTHLSGRKALPAAVVQHIVAKTDGVPLYVEELTKMLLASHLLHEEAGAYVLTGPLLSIGIPDTLQDSLMARLDQLNTAKQVVQLAAVLGREFPYALIQAVSSWDEKALRDGLTQLVEAELLYQRGRPPRAQYTFKHALIQDAAYASLLKSTRQQFHRRIATILDAQFSNMTKTEPEVLAYHYTQADLKEQAVAYWRRAGERAIAHSAHIEAIAHFTSGLEALTGTPDSPKRSEYELGLQLALGRAWMARKGYAAPEVERVYARARELCRQVGETPRLLQVMLGLMTFYFVRARLQTARELGEECLHLAQRSGDTTRLQQVHLTLGTTLCNLGALTPARDHLQQGIVLYTRQQSHPRAIQDPGVACNAYCAWVLWVLGYPEQALERSHAALALARELSHPLSRVYALMLAATVCQHMRDAPAVHEHTETGMAVSTEQEFLFWQALGMVLRGWLLMRQGQNDQSIAQIGQGIDAWQSTGAEMLRPYLLSIHADAYGMGGQVDMGLSCLDEALEAADRHDERLHQAELYRLQGEFVLSRSFNNPSEAEACFQHALEIARGQEAKSWELRAATSLARLWQSQGKCQDASDLLAPVYEWFTEGFDTADLVDAKVLLDELGTEKIPPMS